MLFSLNQFCFVFKAQHCGIKKVFIKIDLESGLFNFISPIFIMHTICSILFLLFIMHTMIKWLPNDQMFTRQRHFYCDNEIGYQEHCFGDTYAVSALVRLFSGVKADRCWLAQCVQKGKWKMTGK